MDDYAKWLSSTGMVEQEKLNNSYNDVVVRGKLHEVMTILGYLNATSIAEELEITKQKMRNSSRSSLDESMTIYPVQFQPNNWFKALTPNLNPTDLTMASESVQDLLIAKQRELARAKSELARMNLMNVDTKALEVANGAVEAKKKEFKQKEDELTKGRTRAVVDLAKAIYKAYPAAPNVNKEDLKKKALAVGGVDVDGILDGLGQVCDGIANTQKLQDELNASMEEYQTLKAKQAELQTKDWKFNKAAAEQRVQELVTEVEFYQNLLAEVVH